MCNALELNALPRARVDGECEHVYERVAMTETERANWKEEVWRWCWTVRGVGWMFCGPHERAWTHKAGLRFDTVKGLGQCRRARAFDRCDWSRMNMRERNVSVRFVEGKVWIMCCRCTRVSDRGVWNREQSRGWCRDCFGSSAYTGEMQLEDINVDTKPKVKKKGPLDEKLQTGFKSLSISANEPRPETEERMLEPMPKQFRPEEWDDNEETLVWNEAPKPKGNGKKRSGDEDVVPDAPRKRRR